ncbi:MAG: hypothetical protein LIP23_02120 [Planctomycetes bacterium]|nr:hypothetical protein [Planctomycetota bacterium]
MINTDCVKSDRIVDVECCYKDGVFYLGRLPSCLPALFTARFTAPQNFTVGDVFVVRDNECAPKTLAMEEPADKIFCAGAVVRCDIDMEREMIFFSAGLSFDPCRCEFQTGDLAYYIDPNGDDSPTTPGTEAAPFKSIMTAYTILSNRRVPASNTTFYINPGSYPAEAIDIVPGMIAHNLIIRATNVNDKPTLDCSTIFRGASQLSLVDLNIDLSKLCIVSASRLVSNGCAFKLSASFNDAVLMNVAERGNVIFNGTNVLDFSGKSMGIGLNIYGYGAIDLNGMLTIKNATSFTSTFAFVGQKGMYTANTGSALTYNSGITGRRYTATSHGIIVTNGGGANYFPGSDAGIAESGGAYYP